MSMNLTKRENALRKYFQDLRFGLTEEEIEEMEEIKKFMEEMKAIPESEKRELSQELQDRMQNEAEAGYIEVSEEQRQKWRKQWLKEVEDE